MKLPKFLRLPTPKEIGKSKYNSLPMEEFGAKPEDYTWEKYYAEMKKDYPIRYFIYETLAFWISCKIIKPISDFKYYIVSHTIRKYHILDLRSKPDNYKFGWCDADHKMLLALMKITEDFIVEQDTESRLIWLKEELAKDTECKENSWKESIIFCEDLLSIQSWWRSIRPMEYEKSFSGPEFGLKYDEYLRENDNAVMKKLIDMRHRMWT